MTPLEFSRQRDVSPEFLAAPLSQLYPGEGGDFEIYVRHGGVHVLFVKSGETLSERHRAMLRDHGVDTVYIRGEERERYRRHVRRRLPLALLSPELPVREKAKMFYGHACDLIRDIIREKLPQGVGDAHRERFFAFVRQAVRLLSSEQGLRRVAELMNHDYDLYSHGLHVFVYSSLLLKSLGWDQERIAACGAGAMLHDAGKERIDPAILKKPGPLDAAQWEGVRQHPRLGAELCQGLALPAMALDCLLLHHERLDGRGYPLGLSGEAIPVHVRAVTLADVYDALTADRVYAAAVKPFEALRIMRDEMKGAFDMDLYRRLVMLLSGADLL